MCQIFLWEEEKMIMTMDMSKENDHIPVSFCLFCYKRNELLTFFSFVMLVLKTDHILRNKKVAFLSLFTFFQFQMLSTDRKIDVKECNQIDHAKN